MSAPKAPYYYKKYGTDVYHWELSCEHVPANVETNNDWSVSQSKPSGREQCNQCKTK